VAKNDYSCSASQRANLLSNAQATVVLAESSKIASFLLLLVLHLIFLVILVMTIIILFIIIVMIAADIVTTLRTSRYFCMLMFAPSKDLDD